MSENKSKSKIAYVLLAILLAVAVVTCPKREQHVESVSYALASTVSEESPLGVLFGKGISTLVTKNTLDVKNFFLFSVGTVHLKESSRIVSFGIFGHVFTIHHKQIDEAYDNLPDFSFTD